MGRLPRADVDHPGAAERVEMSEAPVGHAEILRPLGGGLSEVDRYTTIGSHLL
jgi:hypothetical protein